MTLTRPELQTRLNALEAQLPALVREHPDPADFWPAYAGVADEIVDAAGADDCEWVDDRLEEMLRHHGAPELHDGDAG